MQKKLHRGNHLYITVVIQDFCKVKVFGTDIFLYANLFRAKVFGTDICLGQTYESMGKVFIQNFFIFASIWLQTILFGPP